jgi:acetoacetyl-CoA synthase
MTSTDSIAAAAPAGHPATPIGVLGTGSCLPRRVVSNSEVGAPAGVDDAWIQEKTGIGARRWVSDGEATSDLAYGAARAALDDAAVDVGELARVVVSTSTPDSPQPPTAALLAHRLGAPAAAAAFDLNAVCSGFVFALDVARRLAASEGPVLVVAGDVYSPILDRTDRRTAVLLGDGAGAAVLGTRRPRAVILGTRVFTFGAHSDLIHVDAGGSREPTSVDTVEQGAHHFRMQGREVAQFVRDHVPGAVEDFLAEHRVDRADVAHVVPHQANGRMIETLGKDLDLPRARVHSTVEHYGNTGSASAAVTLDEAARGGRLHPGDLVLVVTFGGGMSAGMALLRWS